ncbi:MAG: sporulation protein YqfD [Oscillospiraceae bacterium]|nr:sporulation protein YqfD [Oscillospiraceae bacterium]
MIPVRERIGFCVAPEDGRDMDAGRLMSSMRARGIRFVGVKATGGMIYGYVTAGGYRELTALSEEMGLTCSAITRRGVIHAVGGYRRRAGLVIGLILSVVIAAAMSGRVTVIEIGGSEAIPRERIVSLLRDTGIYIGCNINDVDLREAERLIRAMDKDIAWIGIRHTGSRVVVEVDDIDPYPEIKAENTPCNIIATRDAQIKGVKVYNGQLIPMVGDGVKKGDVIISGVVDTKYGRSYYVHAIGEITGVYSEKMTFAENFSGTERVTGGVAVKKALSVFGRRIIYSSEGNIDGDYEYSERETPLTLGKIEFPLSRVEMTYRLQEEVPVTRTPDEVREILGERIERYERNFLSDGVTVTDRQVEERVTKSGIAQTVTYTVEGSIGEERQIFARYERFDPGKKDEEKKEEMTE